MSDRFWRVPAILPREVGSSAFAVLGALSSRLNGKGKSCWPGLSTICEDTGLSRRTVIRAVQALEDHGCVTCHRETGKPNKYDLQFSCNTNRTSAKSDTSINCDTGAKSDTSVRDGTRSSAKSDTGTSGTGDTGGGATDDTLSIQRGTINGESNDSPPARARESQQREEASLGKDVVDEKKKEKELTPQQFLCQYAQNLWNEYVGEEVEIAPSLLMRWVKQVETGGLEGVLDDLHQRGKIHQLKKEGGDGLIPYIAKVVREEEKKYNKFAQGVGGLKP